MKEISDSKHSIKLKMVVLSVSVALSLVLAEQAYRFFLFGTSCFSYSKMSNVNPIGVSGLIEESELPDLMYQLKPNLNSTFKLTPFKTNAWGQRDKEYTLAKPTNTLRIALVGDSFSMPAGVAIEDAYHSIVERRLNELNPDKSYEIINFAVGGYNLRQYLALIKNKLLAFSPDLIIVGFCPANDHVVSAPRSPDARYTPKPFKNSFYHSFLLEYLRKVKPYWSRGSQAHGNTSSGKYGMLRKRGKFTFKQQRYIRQVLSEMSQFVRDNKLPVVIAFLNVNNQESYSQSLQQLVEDAGMNYVELSLPFDHRKISRFWIYPGDSHPNGEAHLFFAEQLFNYLMGDVSS